MNFKFLTTIALVFSILITACSETEEDKIAAKEVADNFIEAIEDGDIREAKKYCDKDTRDLILEYEVGFVDFFEREKFKLKEPKITNGKKAKISAKGRTINIVFNLVKDDSEWKISMDDLEDWEGSDNSERGQSQESSAVGEAGTNEPTEEAYSEPDADYRYNRYRNAPSDEEAQFLCANGQSIPYRWYNDGDCDCSDCSDEPNREARAEHYESGYEETAIQANEAYESAMGEYNRAMREYNEVYQETPTYSDEVYYCWDGQAIPWSYLNDGDCDCDNCEDEDE